MPWYKIISWNIDVNNGKPELVINNCERINESEIPELVHDTLYTSVIDDIIDDYYEAADICGNKYPASLALRSTDALLYNEMRDDICDMVSERLIDELPSKPICYQAMIEQCLIYWE